MPNIILGMDTKYMTPFFGEYTDPETNEICKGDVEKITHDGDTVKVSVRGNFSVRLIAGDAAEISCDFKHKPGIFYRTDSDQWKDYLTNINTYWKDIQNNLNGLYPHISSKLNAETAINQRKHAEGSRNKLIQFIQEDMTLLGLNKENFKFFTPFSFEIMDRYGRLLSFIYPDLKNPMITGTGIPRRMPSYNERLLEAGAILPYFIFPNGVCQANSILEAVGTNPQDFRKKLNDTKFLQTIRQAVKTARTNQVGVFDAHDPLILEPFELRYISRQQPPDRPFIDLSSNDNMIHNPLDYPNVKNQEDRLFIPKEFVPLFMNKGWEVYGTSEFKAKPAVHRTRKDMHLKGILVQ